MKRLSAISFQLSAILLVLMISLISCARKDVSPESNIDYYTCGMHPDVRISPEEYDKGKVNCPICNMKLTPVYKEGAGAEDIYYGCGMEGEEHIFQIKEVGRDMVCPICGMPLEKLSKEKADALRGVVSRVKIKGEQAKLAGVRTEAIRQLHLYKEIRAAGTVAYDPKLAVAEEEFISSLKAQDKIREGNIPEIAERQARLVKSSKRKLLLLGLSEEQIEELEDKREVHTSLVLPEEKMWIYGDVYEYELSLVKVGHKIKVTTAGYPGEMFGGVISSINPVVDSKTRSIRFRAQIDNPDLKLKPQMYVDVVIIGMYTGPQGGGMVKAIRREAVLDTGIRKIVWVDKGNGEYEGREIHIGPEATADVDGEKLKFYPVLSGLAEGENVVIKANFLIDSQSQITGVAASAYGGAIGAEEKEAPPIHQH